MENLQLTCKICSQECVNVETLKDGYENDSVFDQYLPLIFKYASVQAKDVYNLKCHMCRQELLRTCRFLELMEQAPLLLDLNKQLNDAVVKTERNINNLSHSDQDYFGDNQLKENQTISVNNFQDEDKKPDIRIAEHNVKNDISNGAKATEVLNMNKQHDEMFVAKSNIAIGSEKLKRKTKNFRGKKKNHIPEKSAIKKRTKKPKTYTKLCGTQMKYICEICNGDFSTIEHLKLHMPIHSEKKIFKCDICSKGFSKNYFLKMHNLCHTGEKKFKCSICSKTFSRKQYLQMHQFKHTNVKPFRCKICSKAFSWMQSLRRHMLLHTGEKHFKCNICSKAYSQNEFLKRHLFVIHSKKPYTCEICSESFTLKTTLVRHMEKIHSNIISMEEKTISIDEVSKKNKSELCPEECLDKNMLEEQKKLKKNLQKTSNLQNTECNINIGNLKQLLQKRMGIPPS